MPKSQHNDKLGFEETGSGKIRYRKQHGGRTFTSKPPVDADTRANARDAWQQFIKWRDAIPALPANPSRIDYLKNELARLQAELSESALTESDLDEIHDEIRIADEELRLETIAVQRGVDLQARRERQATFYRSFDIPPLSHTIENEFFNHDLIGEPLPDDRLMSHWKQRWFDVVDSKGNKPKTVQNIRRDVKRFVDFIGESSPVATITSDTWEAFCLSIKSQNLAGSTECDIFSRCASFVEYLYKKDLIDLPKNLKDFKGVREDKEQEHYTLPELRYMLDNTEGYLKCFLLLMMNCGMYPSDIANLTPNEVKDGRIRRKRSKRKKGEKLPTVTWKLWPETLELIEKYRTDKDGVVFTRPGTGDKWYKSKRVDDKLIEYNPIRKTLWLPWCKKHPQRLTLKHIRKAAAHYLPAEKDQLSAQIKFLGQRPSGVALQHYVDVEQELFENYVMGLRDRIMQAKA